VSRVVDGTVDKGIIGADGDKWNFLTGFNVGIYQKLLGVK